MSESSWQIAYALATLSVTGLAFLAWHSPPLFRRFQSYIYICSLLGAMVYFDFGFGASVAIDYATTRVPGVAVPALRTVQAELAPSYKLCGLILFVCAAAAMLGIVAGYRQDHDSGERQAR